MKVGAQFATHETANHSAKKYARDNIHVNSAEGYFDIFKRGMRGVYQHCAEKHLHRNRAEFDFRYNHREKLGFSDCAWKPLFRALSESVSPIGGLTQPDFKYQAVRFLRWREKQPCPKPRQIWVK